MSSNLPGRETLRLRYRGHWLVNGLWFVPSGSSIPSGEFIDRIKLRGSGETEVDWSLNTPCPRFLGLKVGPVRIVRVVQGAQSGGSTTRTDWIYATHTRSRVNLRVHMGISPIEGFTDYLAAITPADIFVKSASRTTPADTINGLPPVSFPGQWQDWTQVSASFGQLVHFFAEPRPISAGERKYYYVDMVMQNLLPQFENGSYGNHGEHWEGPTSDHNDLVCDPFNPGNLLLRFAQVERTTFVVSQDGDSSADEGESFADLMARPLRTEIDEQQQLVTIPPHPSPPQCIPTLVPSDPQSGRWIDQRPDVPIGCPGPPTQVVIYRALGAGSFSFLSRVNPGLTYRDWHIYRGQTYRYIARAQNREGVEGPASNIVTVMAVDTELPASVTNLVATPQSSAIALAWDHSTAWDLRGYNVYLSTVPAGPYTKANPAIINLPTKSFNATGLQNGTTYYAVVRGVDWGSNESVNSAEVFATPGP